MEFTVGAIVEGKVKSITNFGAFISLPEGRTGMVHISEIAHAYVSDIRQHLTEGQDVKVMILAAENGKINLSIKRTVPQPERQNQPRRSFEKREPRPAAPQQQNRRPEQRSERPERPERSERPSQPEQFTRAYTPVPSKDQSFEDKLKQFMSESDSKLSSVRQYSEHKTKTRRR
ncbi:MAG: S1 RNA-binding domain-containing protein [Oscillospiraceae bacterium]|nr:S1 RNA-binding domain-containing protein [Oscillospiraceae bacterium]